MTPESGRGTAYPLEEDDMRMTAALHLGNAAHHEAAHAVVALTCGLGVEACRIGPVTRGRYPGDTGITHPDDLDTTVADALLTVYTAGAIGTYRYLRTAGVRNARWWADRGAGLDRDDAHDITACSSLTWDTATAAAERILAAAWPRVEQAASRLAADLYLPGRLI